MRHLTAALLALATATSCAEAGPPVATMADAGFYDAPPVASPVDGTGDGPSTVGDAATPGDDGVVCIDRVRGIGMSCPNGCDYVSCGRCGTVCPRWYSCCSDGDGRPAYCCITP